MKRVLETILICSLLPSFAFAQVKLPLSGKISAISITGTVRDSSTQSSLSRVTVMVQESGGSQHIASTLTNEKGHFELKRLPEGQYQVTLSCIGYKTTAIHFYFSHSSPMHLGTISLVALDKKLQEVRVSTQKSLVEQHVDKLTYNVDADPESRTASALDIMRKIPFLTTDADDNLQLNGSDNYRVLINGKSSTFFLRNQGDLFNILSASSIKLIEVMTVPSSKYEAQGVGGVINIITHKNNIGGYNGSFNLRASSPLGLSTNGNITAGLGNISITGDFSYATAASPANTTSLYRLDKIRHSRLEQGGISTNNNTLRNLGGEISYELNSLNLLTASYSKNQSKGDNNYNQDIVMFNTAGEAAEIYRRLNAGKSQQYGDDFSLNFQRSFKNNVIQQLTLSYNWSKSTNGNTTDFTLQPSVYTKGRESKTSNDDGLSEQTFQADYVHPFKKHTVMTGVNAIRRRSSSDYFYVNQDTATGAFLMDSSQSNFFYYQENIYAAYTSVNIKTGKWGLTLGARLEHAKIDANFVSSGTSAVREYINLIPTITLSRKLKGISMFKLSYTHRINRPTLDYLNPYVDLTDPWNISYGNPGLQPALMHVFNVAYNTHVQKTSLNLSFFHQFTNSSIQQFTTLGTDTVAHTSFGNIGQNRNYNLSLSGNATVSKYLNINLNGSANYIKFSSTIGGKPSGNSGLTYNIAGSVAFRAKTWRVSGNVGYNAPNVLLQGKSAGFLSNSISLNKQFLKNRKATVGLMINNPFQEYRHNSTKVDNETFYMLRQSYSVIRRFTLTLTCRFGKI